MLHASSRSMGAAAQQALAVDAASGERDRVDFENGFQLDSDCDPEVRRN